MEKAINEKLNQFLYALEDFLSVNAEYVMEDIKVVYMTQWQQRSKRMFARGVVKIGEAYYPVHLSYNFDTDKLTIKSEAFLFYLSYYDVVDFIAQAVQDGDS